MPILNKVDQKRLKEDWTLYGAVKIKEMYNLTEHFLQYYVKKLGMKPKVSDPLNDTQKQYIRDNIHKKPKELVRDLRVSYSLAYGYIKIVRDELKA